MKTISSFVMGAVLYSLLAAVQPVSAQGTAFTYQGQLASGTSPATGTYDFTFALYSGNATNTTQVGSTVTNLGVGVTNGLFTVTLDFGANFNGASRWLAIGVRTNGGASFTGLNPLQNLTPTPYAIYTPNAGVAILASNASSVAASNIVGTVQPAQINDGGTSAFEGFQEGVQALGGDTSLVFSNLFPIATVSSTPQFSLTVNGAAFGTVVGFAGTEGISQPYNYVVEAQTTSVLANPDSELGLAAQLTFARNGRTTSFGGIVTGCALAGSASGTYLYTIKIESGLAYLALNTDYQMYQNENVPNIVSTVFAGDSVSAPATNLTTTYETHSTLTQYAETDLNFVSRIMENEGIFYFFNQSSSPPVLTLGDNTGAYMAAPNSPFIYYGDTYSNIPAGAEYIRNFQKPSHQSVLSSTVFAFDPINGASGLKTSMGTEGIGAYIEFGDSMADGTYETQLAAIRQQHQTVERDTIKGSSSAPDLRPGYTFSVTDNSGAGVGGSYLVIAVHEAGYVRTTNGVTTCFFGNTFQAVPSSLVYRPPLQTPKPQAKPCVGTVVGASGDEIYLDKYGRVKVQFDWNHNGTADQNASGWIPVAGPWAGKGRGILFLPRIGDEVLVSFLEGDPDQPIITGSVYDSANVPPVTLPGSQTQSGIFTLSSKGGNGYNELLFEDKTGSEEVLLHAQRDFVMSVLNNWTQSVGANMQETITGNSSENVTGTLSLSSTGAASITSGAGITLTGNTTISGQLTSTASLEGGFNSAANLLKNLDATTNSSPALRVIAQAVPQFGALSVSTAGPVSPSQTNPIVTFGNANTWVSFLDNNGNWFANGSYTANAFINLSDRNAKENFEAISPREVLDKVAALPLSRWNFKGNKSIEHIGPMAQDFHAAFSLGTDDRHIATVDEEGVALAAIQGLNQKLGEKEAEIKALKEQNESLETRLEKLEAAITSMKTATDRPAP